VALTVALALVVGVLGLLAGLIRLGFIASFISEPVLKGFIVGPALTIIIGQVPKLLGVPKSDGDFFEQTWGVISHLGEIDGLTVLEMQVDVDAQRTGLADYGRARPAHARIGRAARAARERRHR
jgi:hypothetical protein